MTESTETARRPFAAETDTARAPQTVFFPVFNARGGLVDWRAEPDGFVKLRPDAFSEIPADIPTDGSWRLVGDTFEPIPMWVARFDAEGGYVGCTKKTLAEVKAGDVAFDHEPDNASDGRYRWDHNLQRFEPRPHVVAELGDTAANNQQVVAAIVGLVDRETLPLALQDQIRFIERSPDTIAAIRKKWAALAGLAKKG